LPFRRTTGTATPTLMSPAYIRFQQMPHQVLSRYIEIAGTHVLEIGGLRPVSPRTPSSTVARPA
jgi:hypothetical protein